MTTAEGTQCAPWQSLGLTSFKTLTVPIEYTAYDQADFQRRSSLFALMGSLAKIMFSFCVLKEWIYQAK